MRTRCSFPVFLLASMWACCGSPRADALVGSLNSVLADPQDKEFLWINPSNGAGAADTTGLEAGFASQSVSAAFSVLLHLPHGFAAGVSEAGAYPNDGYYYPDDRTHFTAFSAAKRGFGDSPALSGLSVGLATRWFPRDVYRYGEDSRIVWTLDGGLGWDSPAWEAGELHAGLFAVQTSPRFLGSRLAGLQLQWRDGSGIWDAEGSVILYDPSRPTLKPHYFEAERGPLFSNRLALAFHAGWVDLGGQFLPVDDLAWGPLFRLNIPIHSLLRRLSFIGGFYIWSEQSLVRIRLDIGMRATFQFRRPPGEAYAEYRAGRSAPAPAGPAPVSAPLAAADTATVQVLDEASWEQREALYRERKIGVWRGVVWPYVNTFGFFTTLLIPSGTSCLGVGDYEPGFALLGLWSALVAYDIAGNGSPEFRGGVYAIGQVGLKLADLIFSQIHVRKSNHALRARLKLGAVPIPGGGSMLAGMDF